MLKQIYIKNFAIISELELTFSSGLNILTGETGAGKSIIVDGIELIIGGRASSDMVRFGESKAVVECLFDISNNKRIKDITSNIDSEISSDELILRREISTKGTSRCFLNDSPVPVAKLKELGAYLVDFHGQHEHQSLLNTSNHITLLDMFAEIEDIKNEYQALYKSLLSLTTQRRELIKTRRELLAKYDFLKLQLEEITKVNPKENEADKLEAQLKVMENAEYLVSLSSELQHILYDDNSSAFSIVNRAKKIIESLSEYEPEFEAFLEELISMSVVLKEISSFAKSYSGEIEFNPAKIEESRSRYSLLKKIMKKYGSINEILLLKKSLTEEIALIENFDDRSEIMLKDIIRLSEELGSKAKVLSSVRKEKALLLERAIEDKLSELGFEAAQFHIDFKSEIADSKEIIENEPTAKFDGISYKAFQNGTDKVEFFISANKGSSPKPLSETASGGEISRIMLAMKSLLAVKDEVPIMVFDEIDTGISGRIARKVGLNMKSLGKDKQIISITHLPQIASLGDQNISVVKYTENGATFAQAKILDTDEKIQEIAKLISGEQITSASLNNALQLIEGNSDE